MSEALESHSSSREKTKNLPRLRTILLIINMALLLVMVSGLNLLRVYENSLIRQTETELNTQAIFISALLKNLYLEQTGISFSKTNDDRWQPIPAKLDISQNEILATEPEPEKTGISITFSDLKIGAKLMPTLKEAQRFTLASIQVVDRNGTIFAATNESLLGLSMINRKEVKRALLGKHISLLRYRTLTHETPSPMSISRSADFRVHVMHPLVMHGKIVAVVSLSRTPKTLWQAIGQNRYQLIFYVVSAFLLVWVVSIITAITVNRPIAALINQAERTTLGERSAVTPLKNPITKEVDTLSKALSGLASTLEQRAEYIMEFASHVSHEFKSPVTSIQGAIELLSEHSDTMSVEERERFYKNLQQDSLRLEDLVFRLLEFAKADLQYTAAGECNLHRILDSIVQTRHDEQINIELVNELDDNIVVNVNDEALDTVINNLIDNAIQAEAKNIEIVLSDDLDDEYEYEGYIFLMVKDDGSGISTANQEKIFTPFFTSKRQQGGTGLGLPIIKSLLIQQQGDISYQAINEDGFRSMFILSMLRID
jgi:signal transduction histidine kinase